jgi:hypothetical protein
VFFHLVDPQVMDLDIFIYIYGNRFVLFMMEDKNEKGTLNFKVTHNKKKSSTEFDVCPNKKLEKIKNKKSLECVCQRT